MRRPFLFASIALALLSAAASAESPRVPALPGIYQDRKAVWDARTLPPNLAEGASFGALEAPPGNRSSGIARAAMQLHNVDFRITGDIGLEVKDLIATLEPVQRTAPVNLDRVEDFVIRLHRGEVLVRAKALTALFNRYILDYDRRSLNNVEISTADNRLKATAGLRLNQLYSVELPSTLEGGLRITSENKLFFDIDGIKVSSLPVADLLKAIGISLPSLIRLERSGVTLTKTGLLLDHRTMFPPPYFAGNVAAARLAPDGLHLTFMDAPMAELAPPQSLGNSFMWIQSGDPKLFGLIVTNAKVAIVPEGQKPLVFDLYNYRKRLSRGRGHISQDGFITLTVPD